MVPLGVYTAVLGATESAGTLYTAARNRALLERHVGLAIAVGGLLTMVLIETFVEFLPPVFVHTAHAFAAGAIALGLGHLLVKGTTGDWALDLYGRFGHRPDWMTGMDDDILAYLDASDSVLSPGIVAYNLEYSREAVNRHLRTLEEHDLVDRVDRGKYRLAERARRTGRTDSTDALGASVRRVAGRFRHAVSSFGAIWTGSNQKSGR
ncbi:MAG: winged-helix domain-containing protein [Halanaeroarchaeum sp.]